MLSRDMIDKLSTQQLLQMINDPRYVDVLPSAVAALTQRKEIKSKLAKGGKVKKYAVGDAVLADATKRRVAATLGKTIEEFEALPPGEQLRLIEFTKAPGMYGEANKKLGDVAGMAAGDLWGMVPGSGLVDKGLAAISRNYKRQQALRDAQAEPKRQEKSYQDVLAMAQATEAPPLPAQGVLAAQPAEPTPQAPAPQGSLAQVAAAQAAKKGAPTGAGADGVGGAAPKFTAKSPTLTLSDLPADTTEADRARIEKELAAKYPDLYADYIKKLQERGGAADKRYNEDKWMALLQTGLGIMGGSSPYAAVNIGQGSQQGLASLKAAKDARDKAKEGAEEKVMQAMLAQQDRAMRMGDTAYGRANDAYSRGMQRNTAQNQLNTQRYGAARDTYNDLRREYEFGVNKALQEKQIGISAAAARDTKEARLEASKLAAESRKEAATIKREEAYFKMLLGAQGQAIREEAQRRAAASIPPKGFFESKEAYNQRLMSAMELEQARLEAYYRSKAKDMAGSIDGGNM